MNSSRAGKSSSKYLAYGLLSFFFIFNLILIGSVELSFDESYYWIYSQFLDWGYYDHPPVVAISIYLGTLIFGNTEFGVRIVPLVMLGISIFYLWKMLKNKISLLNFTLLLFCFPLIGFSGVFALPDIGLLLFSVLYFYQLRNYLNENNAKNAVILAFIIAALFYSKYHGLLIVLLTICGKPNLLKQKNFYLTAGLVVAFYLPHMYWQYTHEFITFKFHLFGRGEKHFDVRNIGDYLGGQFFLMGFLNFILFSRIVWKLKNKTDFDKILIANSFGFLAFLFLMSFRNQIEANWTVSCAIALILLMSNELNQYKKYFISFTIISMGLFIGFRLLILNPTWGLTYQPNDNRLNEILNWKTVRIPRMVQICEGRRIVGDNYQVTSKIAFYLNQPNIPALHLGSRESQYSLLKLQQEISGNERICYLTSKRIKTAVRVETNFKDPIYILNNTSLNELAKRYGLTYEEVIRK